MFLIRRGKGHIDRIGMGKYSFCVAVDMPHRLPFKAFAVLSIQDD